MVPISENVRSEFVSICRNNNDKEYKQLYIVYSKCMEVMAYGLREEVRKRGGCATIVIIFEINYEYINYVW